MIEPLPAHCPVCQAERHSAARRRVAWLLLAALFVVGLFWSNRYEYQLCEYDGCVRIDRWTGRVGWVWNDDAEDADETVRSVRAVPVVSAASAAAAASPTRRALVLRR